MGYIIGNIDKKEYLRPEMFGERDDFVSVAHSYEGVMQGLVVLLADGNNRGGGDLRSDHPIIGTWAGDRIVVVDEAATLPEFSEPGMEDVPYQKQLLSLGKDVSAEVVAAIVEGEGDYSRLTKLNPQHILPLYEQAELQQKGGEALLTKAGRETQLFELQELFWLLGVEAALSPARQRTNLEAGLNKMAERLGRSERYHVRKLDVTNGRKSVPSRGYSREQKFETVVGATMVELDLEFVPSGETRAIKIVFGKTKGTTVAALFEALYPGIEFERAPEPRTRSEEVRKLLSFLDKPSEGAI